MKLKIGYFYPELLNLYGDDGNVQILAKRAEARGFEVQITTISLDSKLDLDTVLDFNVVFMGGGPDSSQKEMYEDLVFNKGVYLKEYIEGGGVGLFICGAYQLLGNYYKSADGSMLDGLGIFDLNTISFGNKKPRCIGNVVCEINKELIEDPTFVAVNTVGNTLVGFENHGGRTYLGDSLKPLAKITMGHGNNSEDSTEGVVYKNAIGTYLHGPILARNAHLADYLIAKGLELSALTKLDDTKIIAAHTASLLYKQ